MARTKKAEGEAAGMTVKIPAEIVTQADEYAAGQKFLTQRQVREIVRDHAQAAVNDALGKSTVAALVRGAVNAQLSESAAV